MVLSRDMRPEDTLYCIGASILGALYDSKQDSGATVESLAQHVMTEHGITSQQFFLGMDWLYLLGAIKMDEGVVVACSSSAC